MPSKKRLTIVLPEAIGLVSKFGKTSRPFVKVANGSLHDGDILLQLTLSHLRVIRRLSREMHGPNPELFEDAKSQYDDLKDELERLAKALQSTNFFNILKRLEIRRETHALVEAGYELYSETKSTSETMQRAELSYNSTVEEVEEGDIPPNRPVRGYAFDMDEAASVFTSDSFDMEGLLDNEAASITTSDPFDDPITPGHTISSQYYCNVYIGCVNADNSDARMITMNNGGSDNSGSIHQNHHPPS